MISSLISTEIMILTLSLILFEPSVNNFNLTLSKDYWAYLTPIIYYGTISV